MPAPLVDGQKVVAENIIAFGRGFLIEVNKDMMQVAEIVYQRMKERTGATDHSLKDLARMGHPYSRRNYLPLHDPDYTVHRQSGQLQAGLFRETEGASIEAGKLTAAAVIGVRDSVGHAIHVIVGTSRMVPRDFVYGSANEVKEQVLETLSRSLKSTTINYAGQKVKF